MTIAAAIKTTPHAEHPKLLFNQDLMQRAGNQATLQPLE
jgi:hypothetical protein